MCCDAQGNEPRSCLHALFWDCQNDQCRSGSHSAAVHWRQLFALSDKLYAQLTQASIGICLSQADDTLQEITPVPVASKAGGALAPVMTDQTLLKVTQSQDSALLHLHVTYA